MCDFILVPDIEIFETASLAREKGSLEHSCLKLFISAWHYAIDKREKIIHISKNLDEYLKSNRYKSDKKKRQGLFSVVAVREGFTECDAAKSQIRLASRLSIDEDKKIYLVTDSKAKTDLLSEDSSVFEIIDSSRARELIKQLK